MSAIAAALILGDKSDVHKSRVRNLDPTTFDIHDRVNFASQKSFVAVNAESKTITLLLEIDTTVSQVMEYFEIFLSRMVMCRRAASFLGCDFNLVINGKASAEKQEALHDLYKFMMSDLVDAWKDAAPFTFAKKTGWADNPEVTIYSPFSENITTIVKSSAISVTGLIREMNFV
jgi:hypothetical protein